MAHSLEFYDDGLSLKIKSFSLRVLPGDAYTSLNQDGFHRGGFWEVVGQVESPFDLSQILLISGDLLVLCFLPGLPVIK